MIESLMIKQNVENESEPHNFKSILTIFILQRKKHRNLCFVLEYERRTT